MEKRLTWSGILVRPDHNFFPLLQNIAFLSGSLICYEFLSPLTPLKVFSWRSWQIESDRQTGSSVRPQESPSSRADSPSVCPSLKKSLDCLVVSGFKGSQSVWTFHGLISTLEKSKIAVTMWAHKWEKGTTEELAQHSLMSTLRITNSITETEFMLLSNKALSSWQRYELSYKNARLFFRHQQL